MNKFTILGLVLLLRTTSIAQMAMSSAQDSIEDRNKRLALEFYEDLWFNDRTDQYVKYMADTYVAHDIGDRKGMNEPAIQQKEIADRFWNSGKLSGEIDFQIADGDLVATRWRSNFEGTGIMGALFTMDDLPIINVFRFNEEGKIVELWNHRHDIDTNQTLIYTIKGLLIGLLLALIPSILAIRYGLKLKKIKKEYSS